MRRILRKSGGSLRPPLFLAVAIAAVVLGSACAPALGAPREVEVAFHFSRFAPGAVDVPRGVPIRFVLRNTDPIDHEWIVGPANVHARHRTGTEPLHDAVPTEVTVPALDTRITTVTFTERGTYAFICHLPGHEKYGMVGTVRVR